MRGVRGMLGKQVVFKRRNGISYVSAPPEINEDRQPTAAQLSIQQKFRFSITYASSAIKDPEVKKAYQAKAKRGQSAHNVAFNDAFNPPEIIQLIATGYNGQAGSRIVVAAVDDFKVASVRVSIRSAADVLIEEGAAVADANGLTWTYTTKQANANVAETRITATAVDLPGNEASFETTI